MRPYSETAKAEFRRGMSPPARQSMAMISEKTDIHTTILRMPDGLAAGGAGSAVNTQKARSATEPWILQRWCWRTQV